LILCCASCLDPMASLAMQVQQEMDLASIRKAVSITPAFPEGAKQVFLDGLPGSLAGTGGLLLSAALEDAKAMATKALEEAKVAVESAKGDLATAAATVVETTKAADAASAELESKEFASAAAAKVSKEYLEHDARAEKVLIGAAVPALGTRPECRHAYDTMAVEAVSECTSVPMEERANTEQLGLWAIADCALEDAEAASAAAVVAQQGQKRMHGGLTTARAMLSQTEKNIAELMATKTSKEAELSGIESAVFAAKRLKAMAAELAAQPQQQPQLQVATSLELVESSEQATSEPVTQAAADPEPHAMEVESEDVEPPAVEEAMTTAKVVDDVHSEVPLVSATAGA